ncbi:hypothetical protein MARINOS108_11421 [Marinoscillum sp. 108]|nr:hypothetical protein MARINOS108_11421 [Marinoscillum sp. 108]
MHVISLFQVLAQIYFHSSGGYTENELGVKLVPISHKKYDSGHLR